MYVSICCIVFSIAYMPLDGLSWYLLLVPMIVFSVISIVVSLISWGFQGLGVRFGFMNLAVSSLIGAWLYWKGTLQPLGTDDADYWHRWL